MKKILLLVIGIFMQGSALLVHANNVIVSQPMLIGQSKADHTIQVQFNLAWANSWRDVTNWDACWLFVKYRVGSGPWRHATLNISGSSGPAGSILTVSADGKGAFIYASAPFVGAAHYSRILLQWNYGVDGVQDNDQVTVKVMAIEMVYVPGSSFTLGSGGLEACHFFSYPTFTAPYLVTSENEISVGQNPGDLYYSNESGRAGDQAGPIPAAFPKGFGSFYCMKYEASQEQYVDFLNMLTYTQQSTRTGVPPNSAARTPAVATDSLFRYGIKIMTPGVSPSTPAVYMCDVNDNGLPDESADGQTIACNWLNWMDQCAYADWAGLRPMTELEYEKASRGRGDPIADEFAWGNTVIAPSVYTPQSAGTVNEGILAGYSTGNCSYVATSWRFGGPSRVGIFAANISNVDRATAGGSFNGIMELSGNLWEMCVSTGHPDGRSFSGSHGDGILSINGNATNSDWPGYASGEVLREIGAGLRGGYWRETADRQRISDRWYAAATHTRAFDMGCRCVRIAP